MGNNLHNSIKKALENYEAPLKDAQWTRLEKELAAKPKKWKFLPYLYSAILIVAVVIGVLLFKYNFNKKTLSINNSSEALEKNYKFEKEQNKQSNVIIKQQFEENQNLSKTLKNSEILKKKQIKLTNNLKPEISETENNNSLSEIKKDAETTSINKTDKSSDTTSYTYSNKNNKGENNINVTDSIDNSIVEIENSSDVTNEDSTYKNKPIKDIAKAKHKYVFSLSTGYSNMKVHFSAIDDLSKVHKDTRKIFEQSNKNTQTLFINFGFDCNVFKGFNIGLNTGFQYLHISQPVNIKYKMIEIPFYDINRNIIGYIPKDSASAEVLSTNSNNKISYLKIPLRFNYTIPLNLRNEMLITAGTNISTIISAKGNVISVNEGLVKPLSKQMYGKLNFGFLCGAQYCRNIKNRWWMGIENQWQINPSTYTNGVEKVKNRMSGYNINLILKYKL
ncbi:MAG: hypothetical protein IT243_04385 [Bacteroidia bacterium]|nr:hypothetical protein [Bacteroidia bacterium]